MRTRRRSATVSVVVGIVIIAVYLGWVWFKGSSSESAATAATTSRTSAKATRTSAKATTGVDTETGLPWIDASDLPSQGQKVLTLIDAGGPYPYDEDGQTFLNAEKLLPAKAKGFYTEYTVKLPSSSDRGPVRIIMGGTGQWYFWTSDHYASFSRIRR